MHSQLYHILHSFRSSQPNVKVASVLLAQDLLARSVLFEHDARETSIWIDALPSAISRAKDASAPDGTPLTSEFEGVLSFLDDCILRCQKTPYRYLEESLTICFGNDASIRIPQTASSPLLATVLEQLLAKDSKSLISLSDTLAIVTYLRKVLISLIGKQPDVSCTIRTLERVVDVYRNLSGVNRSLSISKAFKRETRLLHRVAQALGGGPYVIDSGPVRATTAELDQFLEGIELAIPSTSYLYNIRKRALSSMCHFLSKITQARVQPN